MKFKSTRTAKRKIKFNSGKYYQGKNISSKELFDKDRCFEMIVDLKGGIIEEIHEVRIPTPSDQVWGNFDMEIKR